MHANAQDRDDQKSPPQIEYEALMAKDYLVIVESPGKIKKLKSILGVDYEIVASMGHVMDLPPKSFGIELDTMQADYVVMKADVAKKLRAEAQKDYRLIYLASDPDREGEAISHHVANLLKRANPKVKMQRVTFDAITASAVKAAFAKPRALDEKLVAAQEARRLLDRLVGFPASRFLWQFVDGKGLSAGRVQSVALRLVVERDEAIKNFVPQEYWTITGLFKAAKGEFSAKLAKWKGKKADLKTRADADAVLKALQDVDFKIGSVQPKQRIQKPPAPFTTSSMQQAASSHLRMSPDEAMRQAQTLYEEGYITYMRTDSPAVSPEGQEMAKQTLLKLYDEKYLGNVQYKAKGGAQEAHECIRPTDTQVSPKAVMQALGEKHNRAVDLYELIYRRFLASQMAAAIYDEVHVTVLGGDAVFNAKGSTLAFDGYLRMYNFDEEKEAKSDKEKADGEEEDEPTNKQLPPLTVAEAVKALKLTPEQHFTKPPYPYSEALLVKALENHGVGRPSTYAQIIATLKKRNYVQVEKRKLASTSLGKEVHQVLSDKLPKLFDVAFTAQMETSLDDIAEGKVESRAYLKGFWAQVSPLFGENVVQAVVESKASTSTASPKTTKRRSPARKPKEALPISAELGACPKCGKALVKRNSKRGEFIGCSGFPKCRYTSDVSNPK
jgi:DNA topoisomerase-1